MAILDKRTNTPFAAPGGPRRLAETVADAIAMALLEGRIAPGDALPSEAEISAEFGVSKPIAREALRALASAGLVHTQHGKLSRAKRLNGGPLDRVYGMAIRANPKHMRHANELRLVVEPGVARIAAERQDPEGMEAMREARKGMEAMDVDADHFPDLDVAFHHAIALATGNFLIRVQMEGLESIQRAVSEVFSHRNTRGPTEWAETIDRHVAIAEAIEAGDPDAAETAMRDHFAAADLAAVEVEKLVQKGNGW
ncbi:GntR family transcriptional regulator [Aliiruegeria haliotis]|uniref:GntR family transcriptional regulator n=1 Tax=Aliiruegeria haliotis TaxID=1280846 RepID=A0A2T0RM38_9RHOB|nr:FadR/GntR family transcriptional regulator [Aliiruegeria haliotis]PRY22190.1 GntR family transcriptional regulator [Aliiruegeria haliotis]